MKLQDLIYDGFGPQALAGIVSAFNADINELKTECAELRKAIESGKMPEATKMKPVKSLDDVADDISTASSAIPVKVETKI